jgi:hypothetical protein
MNRFPTLASFGRLDGRERGLLAAFLGLTLLACLMPGLPDPSVAGAAFADGRAWRGMPNAMDVLSNLPFAAFGILGLWRLRRLDTLHDRSLPANALDAAWLFFAGLVLTAGGSVFYHLQPDALRLTADRAGMAIAFAGMIGLAVCERVSQRAGWPAACFSFAAGLLAVAIYHESGNVLPWAVLQFGGMALVLTLALLLRPAPGAMGLKLGLIIFFYAVGKLFELGDQAIYEATGHWVSGHSLKHLVAAFAAWPVLQVLRSVDRRLLRHNPGASAAVA